MNRKGMMTIGMAAAILAALGATGISAQDRYTLKVPGGLAFSEFRGYDGWQVISVSFACHTRVKARDYVFTELGKR